MAPVSGACVMGLKYDFSKEVSQVIPLVLFLFTGEKMFRVASPWRNMTDCMRQLMRCGHNKILLPIVCRIAGST